MIPKKIHFCWFGKNKLPKLALKCIGSWKKYCPDYEIVKWSEDNFNIKKNKYVYQAYQNNKFAFVSDYVRLFALFNFGGVYLDTDVEVLRPLDEFLVHEAFTGFESPHYIPTGIMACKSKFLLFDEFLYYYEDRAFIKKDGRLDTTTNVSIITNIMEKYGLKKNGEYQVIRGLAIYPRDYFCPLDDPTGKLYRTKNTATIHWFNKSWIDQKAKLRSNLTRPFHRVFGVDCFKWLKDYIEPKAKK